MNEAANETDQYPSFYYRSEPAFGSVDISDGMSSAEHVVTPKWRAVGAVVVTFHPDEALEARLTAVAREVSTLVVIDNSVSELVGIRLRAICASVKCHLIPNSRNSGLSALNLGFAHLESLGLSWGIAFDQDSTPLPGFSAGLLRTAKASPNHPPTAAVGANWRDEAHPERPSRHLMARPWPFAFRRVIAQEDLNGVTCVITSGTLFDLSIWRSLAGFDERLTLDLVDTEYCLRAKTAGFDVRVAAAAHLLHQRGKKKPVRLFGQTWWPAFMPPARLHYLFRNRVLVFWRHGWRVPHWTLFELAYTAKILVEIVFLEDQKLSKLAACAHGTWDGLLGRSGPLPPR